MLIRKANGFNLYMTKRKLIGKILYSYQIIYFMAVVGKILEVIKILLAILGFLYTYFSEEMSSFDHKTHMIYGFLNKTRSYYTILYEYIS